MDENGESGYVLFDEALELDLLEVQEASLEGYVNEILVLNKGGRPVPGDGALCTVFSLLVCIEKLFCLLEGRYRFQK